MDKRLEYVINAYLICKISWSHATWIYFELADSELMCVCACVLLVGD